MPRADPSAETNVFLPASPGSIMGRFQNVQASKASSMLGKPPWIADENRLGSRH